jgi:beta-barrel assembly-enhancing protease
MKNPIGLRLSHGLTLSVATALTLLLSTPWSMAQQFDLPDFGSSSDLIMSSTQEHRLGKEFMKSVRKALPVIDDPLLTDYLESLGNRLVAASGAGGGRYDFFFIDNPTINAFAGPDGKIGAFSGLVLASESESELAAVMAHEIAHVTQHHLMRAFEDKKRLSIPATAALVAAVILGAQVDADLGMAAVAGVQAVAAQHQINFTRENEKEADRIGIATLANAGFDPYAMPGFFERLAKASRIYESSASSAPEFLRTHPVTTSRTADAMGRAGNFSHKQRPDDLRFHLMRARLRERAFSSAEKAIAHFRSTIESKRYRNATAARYGYALALTRGNRIDSARSIVGELLAKYPNQAEFIILEARLDAKSGARDKALKSLRTAVGLRPSNIPLRIAYADILMASGEPARALKTLEDVARRKPGNILLYQKMSDAALKSGQKAATHRYRAEKFYAEGELKPAIRQLEIALRQAGLAYHDASKIQVRLDAIKQEEKDAKKKR